MQRVSVSRSWRLFVVLIMVAMSLVITPVAQAATTISISDGDLTSLTNAFNTANSSGTPMVIDLATNGDYVLTTQYYDSYSANYSGLPELTGNVTIHGHGSTIERSPTAPVFGLLNVASGGTLNIDNITLTGGNNDNNWYKNGGAIYSHGTLTVTNSTITGNAAPGGGGGIYNEYGSLTVIGSTISGNSVPGCYLCSSPGGGIANAGSTATAMVVNSTVSGNHADYGGGGIQNVSGTTTIVNSTIVDNSTTNFGGGLWGYSSGSITVTNSIVANNSSSNIASGDNVYGLVTDNGHNDIGTDALLGSLADNGGPTQTIALLSGSTAINAGDDTVCNASPVNGLDQRGYVRPSGSHCDIGAFESGAIANEPPVEAPDQATVIVNEGQTASNTGTVTDANGDTVSLSASVGSVVNNGDGTWSWSFSTSDGPSQTQTVTIGGDDGHGGTSSTTFSLVVNNVAPTATFVTPVGSINNGSTFSLSLTSPSDPSSADTTAGFTYAFDCGSGYGSFSSSSSTTCTATTTPSQSVKAKIKDKDGGVTEYTGTVSISNQAPTEAAHQATVTANEGQTASNTGTVTDSNGDTVSLSASVGSVVNNGDGTWSWSFSTSDGPSQTQTVTIGGDDGHGGTSSTTFSLVVNNVAPTATFVLPSTPVSSGSNFALSLTSPQDPSSVDTTAGFTYAFDCGSGYGSFSSTNSATCTASAAATQSVKAQIKDKDGGVTEYTGTVSLDTTPPTTTPSAVNADNSAYTFGTWTNQSVSVSLSATDNAGGSGVAHTYYILDSGSQTEYSTPVTISSEGSHTITFWSVDNANNEETPHHSVSVNIDLTKPTISGVSNHQPQWQRLVQRLGHDSLDLQ